MVAPFPTLLKAEMFIHICSSYVAKVVVVSMPISLKSELRWWCPSVLLIEASVHASYISNVVVSIPIYFEWM